MKMLHTTCMLALGLAAATFAQESGCKTFHYKSDRLLTNVLADTGPMFNPSEAPHFAYSSLVIPTQTNLPAIQPTDAFSMATTISGIILPTTLSRSSTTTSHSLSHSSSHAASSSASSSASRTPSSTSGSAATSVSASAPAQQSSGAAVANRAGLVSAMAGGLLAGLVLA